MRSIEPGISRFRVWSFGPSRNDTSNIASRQLAMTVYCCYQPAMDSQPLILLAAGGTGGHLFPAEALGVELIRRGYRVRLATDDRALRYSGLFTRDMIDVVASETARGRNPLQLAHATFTLALGTLNAFN